MLSIASKMLFIAYSLRHGRGEGGAGPDSSWKSSQTEENRKQKMFKFCPNSEKMANENFYKFYRNKGT